ncbi:MAG: transketolase [Acidobacteria bacterium]|nr:transketolase [Acidobacteriota bacterium]MBV9478194.1 transketolase [Acidobacteriota bacterium]
MTDSTPGSTAAEGAAAIADAESSNRPSLSGKRELEELCVNTIRFLAVDAVQKANSGHPGTPMGMADMAFVLWTEFLRHDPLEPHWQNRDRFILSAGHASMLLYSLLHLTGYPDMTMDELQHFRQWGSKTAGHPEYRHATGIEVTTGPLGQGFAHGVGMALASKMLRVRFTTEDPFTPVDNHIYAICSDGDLMEGISSEAGSIAGHLGLGNLIYFWDDNHISIEGDTRLAFSEDVRKRFEAFGWHVQSIDGHDRAAVRKAIRKAQRETAKPSLICARTVIGWGSPKYHGTARAHGEPLGADEVKATKAALGWPEEPAFYVPPEVREEFAKRTKKLARERKKWDREMTGWRARNPQLGEEWDRYWSQWLPDGFDTVLLEGAKTDKPIATRALSGQVIQKLAEIAPFVVGGSADLAPSTNTLIKDSGDIARPKEEEKRPPADVLFLNRNLHFGIREHAMGAIVNGMTLYGSWRCYGATFLIFSDYMRPSVRLSALMGIPSIFLYTHDSVFLGEDGPTHQPIEQLWSLRLIPNLFLFRPADGAETAMAWVRAVRSTDSPTAIVLTRQKLDLLPRPLDFDPQRILRGAYVLDGYENGDLTIIATGSEVPLAVKTADLLRGEGVNARVVSAPCLDLFDQQPASYQDEVMGDRARVVAIEAGRSDGWYKYVDRDALVIGIDHFGASAPYEQIAEHFGFTPEQVAARIRDWRK